MPASVGIVRGAAVAVCACDLRVGGEPAISSVQLDGDLLAGDRVVGLRALFLLSLSIVTRKYGM